MERPFPVYIRPQECENLTDVRRISWWNDAGTGLSAFAQGDSLLNASAWPCTLEDLEKADHPYQLPKRKTLTINIDHKQMGVGGINSWGQIPMEKHRLDPQKTYHYRFRLIPRYIGNVPLRKQTSP